MTTTLTLLSLNMNGIQNIHKWQVAGQFFRSNDVDILFLQEVVCEPPSIPPLYNVYTNVGFQNRGTAILTRPGLELKDVESHPDGRIIIGSLNGVLLVNVYAPSGTQHRVARNEFYRRTLTYYLRNSRGTVILGGDHNCVLNTSQSTGNPLICWPMQQLVESLDLVDIVDVLKITRKHYTYVCSTSSSRLDRIYITSSGKSCVRSYDVIPVSFSNHHAVLLRVTGFPRAQSFGRGYWKLNCGLLNRDQVDKDFCALWASWRLCIPRYPSISHWWITFVKPAIKRHFKQEAYFAARDRRQTTEFYYTVLRDLQHQADDGLHPTAEFHRVRSKLYQIQEQHLSGKILTSKDRFFIPGEKFGMYHLSKNAQRGKAFQRLSNQYTQGGLLTLMADHLSDVFSHTDYDARASATLLQHCTRTLSEASRTTLTEQITQDEIQSIVRALPNGRSPGEDGIPYEFYKHYWPVIAPEFCAIVLERIESGNIYPTTERGVFVMIPKTDKPSSPADYRPITLLCADSKIMARLLANRLRSVMTDIIDDGQTCGVPGSSIIQCLTILRDAIIFHHTHPQSQFGILNIDFQNAFDRVDHQYLRDVMKRMNFPAKTMLQLVPQATNTSRVQINGYLSRNIDIVRSIRQGCPLSMLLYIISLEPALRAIAHNAAGLRIDGYRVTVGAYADDVNVLVRDIPDIDTVTTILDTFQQASGAIVNDRKTKILWLGDSPPSQHIRPYTTCESLTILGLVCNRSIEVTLNETWSRLLGKIRFLFIQLYKKELNIYQKVHLINVYALSKLWYISQVLPISKLVCARLTQFIGWFLWRGHIFRVSRQQVTLPRQAGGLGLVCIETKVRALLFKNMIQTLTQDTSHRMLLKTAWNFHPSTSPPPRRLPRPFAEALTGLRTYITDSPENARITTSAVYKYFRAKTSFSPPAELRHPLLHWKTIWTNITDRYLPSHLRSAGYFFINDLFPTGYRRHKIKLERTPQCPTCGAVDTAVHRLVACARVRAQWEWVAGVVARLTGLQTSEVRAMNIIFLDIASFPSVKKRTIVWLVCNYIHYIFTGDGASTLQGLQDQLNTARRAILSSPHLRPKYSPYIVSF